ncbi:MAG TPA: four helix bundle protein [Candidatus Cloacimonadota bacterium]|nr:four helix bundle protein [Candidatus Cloacimonadota bacterium]HPM02587.1 four helix bundle protein [Candidatus Cloacimonadota bacterium]
MNQILNLTERFPKSMRFVLSNRLQNLSLDIIEDITELIYSKDKKAYYRLINLKLEKVRILFRVAYDRHYLSSEQMETLMTDINLCGKMLGGWEKSDERE